MILYFATDLIWATRIKGTADALGLPCRPVRTVDMLRARLADSPVRALVVDLDTPDVAIDLIRTVRAEPPAGGPVHVLAFGPHMAKDAMLAARDAGADEVLPRGAFDRDLGAVLRRLGAGPGEASAGGA